MNPQKRETLKRLLEDRVVIVARGLPPEVLLKIGEALVTGGLGCLEITLDSPDGVRTIERLTRTFGDRLVVGAGTVLDEKAGRAAVDGGARFLVSPGRIPGAGGLGGDGATVLIPGAFTPREILDAVHEGADLVKVFPINLGGPRYLAELRGPLPHIHLMVTGGVTPESALEYLRRGAAIVGIGRAVLEHQAIARGDFVAITERAAALRRSLAGV